jgi:hypothetical protein
LAVQEDAPRQVSRTKTWRNPLLFAVSFDAALVCAALFRPAGFCAALAAADLLAVTATKATNLPEALTEGRMLSVPASCPLGSVETSCVDGVQPDAAPVQVSRK